MTYIILLFYFCTPLLDSMVCADCVGNVPFQGTTTISHLKTLHADVEYSAKSETPSSTATEQGNKSFCSICANSLMGVVIYSPQLPDLVVQCADAQIAPPLSEFHHSIHKPPQNLPG